MKRILLLFAVASSLAACDPIATAKDVQGAIARQCSWVEPVANILKMFSTATVLTTAQGFATQFCNVVTTNPLADGPGPANYKPSFNGVQVKGKFVHK